MELAAVKVQMTCIATEISRLSKMHEALKEELTYLTPLAELMRTEITVKDALAAVKLEIRELKRKKKKDAFNNADLEGQIKGLIKFAEAKNKEKIKLRKQIQLHVTKRRRSKTDE